MCEAGEAPLCLTTATFAPTMCSVGAALGTALEASPELARASERRERPTLRKIPSYGHLGRGYKCGFCSQEAAWSARPNRREEESRRTTDRIATRRQRGLLDDDRRRFSRPPPASDSVLPR
ncbi:hypothetical protein MRX96_038360 [Rhipicephalus microplus]